MIEKIKLIEARLNAYKVKNSNDKKVHAIIAALEESLEAGKSGNYPVGSDLSRLPLEFDRAPVI